MKKSFKSILIKTVFLVFLLLFFSNMLEISKVCAAYDFSSQISASWTSSAYGSSLSSATTNVVATIVNIIRIVGTGVAIIMIMYVAIKYMSAAPTEKAEFKKSATAYIVGAVVLFASSNILKVIADFATSNIF